MKAPHQQMARVPGGLVVGAWVVLFMASVGVAALVDWAEYQDTIVGRAQRRVEQLAEDPLASYTPDWRRRLAEGDRNQPVFRLEDLLGPDSNRAAPAAESDAESAFASYRERFGDSRPMSALDSARNNLERKAQAERWAIAGALGAGLAWLLAFVFLTLGTGRWVTVNEGWARVQSWHGGKLSMLYLPLTAAVVLYGFAATGPIDDAVGVAVLFITSALLLLACATMLVRATWNWLTGRETQRKAVGDRAGPEPPRVPRP